MQAYKKMPRSETAHFERIDMSTCRSWTKPKHIGIWNEKDELGAEIRDIGYSQHERNYKKRRKSQVVWEVSKDKTIVTADLNEAAMKYRGRLEKDE